MTSVELCGQVGVFENVLISFYCGADAAEGGKPAVREYKKQTCTHHIDWHSSVACDVQYVGWGRSTNFAVREKGNFL